MTPSSMRIGKCAVKAQGKVLVQLKGINLPKIGSKAFVSKEGKSRPLGDVVEAIGSTQRPWIVISASKNAVSGATSLGLRTTVQPASKAGATLATT